MAPAIKGEGFDHNGGGFAEIWIGDKKYPKSLIAEAPNMLASLKVLVSAYGGGDPARDAPMLITARKVIAKAEGH